MEKKSWKRKKKEGDLKWEQHIGELYSFHRANGHLSIPEYYYAKNPGLKEWVSYIQELNRDGSRPMYLTSNRKRALDRIGFEWDVGGV